MFHSGTFAENKLVKNYIRQAIISVIGLRPSTYTLELDFLNPVTGQRVDNYYNAYFIVQCGLRNAKNTKNLKPGVHVIIADSIDAVAVGAQTSIAVKEFQAYAQCVPSPGILPQWEEI